MTIDLGLAYENQLRSLAAKQGREIGALIVEAVREYLEAATITDVSAEEVAQSQLAMFGELGEIPARRPSHNRRDRGGTDHPNRPRDSDPNRAWS